MSKQSKQRGRPIGFKLSEISKKSIGLTKTGQRHKQSTKDKISKSLIIYFKNLHPLSEDINKKYGSIDNKELNDWFNDKKEDLDCIDDVKTERSMRNVNRTELSCGSFIEIFSHKLTPEQLVIFKEEFESGTGDALDIAMLNECI